MALILRGQLFQRGITRKVAVEPILKDDTALCPEKPSLSADNRLYLLSFHKPVDPFMIDAETFSTESYSHPAIPIIRTYRMNSPDV